MVSRGVWCLWATILAGLVAATYAQPPSTLQQFFILRPAQSGEMVAAYNDDGAPKKSPLTTWNFQNKQYPNVKWLPFGSYACNATSRSLTDCMKVVQPLFAVPAFDSTNIVGIPSQTFTNYWNSEHSGSKQLGNAWIAGNSHQYYPISTVWTSGEASGNPVQPNTSSTYLVNQECITQCWYNGTAPPLVWNTEDYPKKVQSMSLWQPYAQLGISIGNTTLETPSWLPCIKPECISFSQIFQIQQIAATANLNNVVDPELYMPQPYTMISETVSNTGAGSVTETITGTKQETNVQTFALTQSIGYAETMDTTMIWNINLLGILNNTFEINQNFQFSNQFTTTNQESTSVVNTYSMDVAVTVPANTNITANLMAYQVQQLPVPVVAQLIYTGYDYAQQGYVQTEAALEALMTRTGFNGTFGTWFPNNQSLSANVTGFLNFTDVYHTEVSLVCKPIGSTPCPTTLTVSSTSKSASAQATILTWRPKLRRRRIKGIRKADGSAVFNMKERDVKFLNILKTKKVVIPKAQPKCRYSRIRNCA